MGNVTRSGNEITDASRIAALEGDGIDAATKRDGSHGIWEATENLVPNGGMESNATGWTGASAAFTRSTDEAKFGDASGKFIPAAQFGSVSSAALAVDASSAHFLSLWLKGSGGTVTIALIGDDSGTTYYGSDITLTDAWQRVTLAKTTSAGDTTIIVRVYSNDASPTVTAYVDGVQLEKQPLATPYVETDGAAASRTAARVRMPASLLDETQGWIAIKVRSGFVRTAVPSASPYLFGWGDDGTKFLYLIYDGAWNYSLARRNADGAQIANAGIVDINIGDELVILAAWTATLVRISRDGAAFVEVGGTPRIPVLSATTFDIARNELAADNHFDSDVLWVACGTGVLTDADAAAIAALGEAHPSDFSATAVVTAVWNANDGSYREPEDSPRVAQVLGVH